MSSKDEAIANTDTVEVSAKTGESSKDGDAKGENPAASEKQKADDTAHADAAQTQHDNALSLPPKARDNNDATAMVRAWIVDQQLVCTLRPEIWEDPGTWGVLLADVAYQVSNANAELRGIPAKQTLAAIAAAFNKEMPAASQSSSKAGQTPTGESAPKDTADKMSDASKDSATTSESGMNTTKADSATKANSATETDTTDGPEAAKTAAEKK